MLGGFDRNRDRRSPPLAKVLERFGKTEREWRAMHKFRVASFLLRPIYRIVLSVFALGLAIG
jgi:hypothetical protein